MAVVRNTAATLVAVFFAATCGFATAQALHPDDRITEARNAAVGYAISMDLLMHRLAFSCAAYGGDARSRTAAARHGWTRRNGALVDAAHRYLRMVEARIAQEQGEAAGTRFYEERKSQFETEAQAFLEQRFEGKPDAFATCRSIASSLDSRELELGDHETHAAELRALALELPAAPAR